MLKAKIMYCTVILYPKSICQNTTPLGNPHNSLEKLHPPRKYSIDTMPKQPDVKLHLQPTLPNNIHLLSTKMLVYLSYLNNQLMYYLYRNFFKDTIWCNSSCLHVFEGVTVSTKFFFFDGLCIACDIRSCSLCMSDIRTTPNSGEVGERIIRRHFCPWSWQGYWILRLQGLDCVSKDEDRVAMTTRSFVVDFNKCFKQKYRETDI